MSNALRASLLFATCLLGSLLAGCAKDPVIPESDIPAIPPSTRSMPGAGGPSAGPSGESPMPAAPAN
jgi:hypothetical protein